MKCSEAILSIMFIAVYDGSMCTENAYPKLKLGEAIHIHAHYLIAKLCVAACFH